MKRFQGPMTLSFQLPTSSSSVRAVHTSQTKYELYRNRDPFLWPGLAAAVLVSAESFQYIAAVGEPPTVTMVTWRHVPLPSWFSSNPHLLSFHFGLAGSVDIPRHPSKL
jgi:hypothetical protein